MNKILGLLLMGIYFTSALHADGRNVLGVHEFMSELNNFMEDAEALMEMNLGEMTDEQNAKYEAKFKELDQTARLLALAYYESATDDDRDEYIKAMSTAVKENKKLQTYFRILGNAFVAEGNKLIESKKVKAKKIMLYSAIGGVVLGGVGATLIYRMGSESSRLTRAAVTFVGVALAVTAAGYSSRFILPVAPAVKNAEDFRLKYPQGEDFVNELSGGSADLALGLKTITQEGEPEDDL